MNSKEKLEETLLKEFIAAHLDCGGDVQVKEHLWTGSYPPMNPEHPDARECVGFACLRNDKIEGSWIESEGPAQSVLRVCSHLRVRWDDIVFYPGEERTGVPWRMLKLDMSFLRIVLLNDKRTLLAITTRLASIVSKTLAEGLGQVQKPELN